MNKVINDKELGKIVIRVNARAARFTFRTKSDAIYVTVPQGSTMKDLQRAIDELRQKLVASLKKVTNNKIDLSYRIDADFYRLSFTVGNNKNFISRSRQGEMIIVCPPQTNFDDPDLQIWLRKVIEESLRRNAKGYLPNRIQELSIQHKLPFNDIRINSSKGRWGSCSAKKNINLSYFLMLLPAPLIDYVLLHELAHTIEMNHSDKFWALLDKMTEGKAKALRNQLKSFKTDF